MDGRVFACLWGVFSHDPPGKIVESLCSGQGEDAATEAGAGHSRTEADTGRKGHEVVGKRSAVKKDRMLPLPFAARKLVHDPALDAHEILFCFLAEGDGLIVGDTEIIERSNGECGCR
jgi:hypothetical protein